MYVCMYVSNVCTYACVTCFAATARQVCVQLRPAAVVAVSRMRPITQKSSLIQ